MDSILGAEILKSRKRWMPYVLFAMCIIGVLFLLLPVGYFNWESGESFEDRTAALYTFSFPYSVPALLDSGQFWGAMFTGILAASVVATEFNWGTVRQALLRGQSRSAYLAVKIAAIVVISTLMLLVALLFGLIISLYTTVLADESITLDVPDGPSVPDLVLMVARAALGILPYGLMAFMLATVSRSSTLGITGVIVYLFGEAIGIALLDSLGGFGPELIDLSVGENVKALVAENRIGLVPYNSMAPREQIFPGEAKDVNVAALILIAHSALYCAISFWAFERRDVKGG